MLFVSGDFTAAGEVTANRVAAWDGSRWNAFGDGFDAEMSVVLGIDEGPLAPALLAGGDFYAPGAIDLNRIAIWKRTSTPGSR